MIESQRGSLVKSEAELGFFQEFKNFSLSRIKRLSKTIFGNIQYVPKNTFSNTKKEKIFSYLQTKYMTTVSQLEDESPKKFTNVNMNYGSNMEFKNLKSMKEILLKLKTNLEAAEDGLEQAQISNRKIKADFMNEVAYEFDRQRQSSIGWGILFGSIICSTFYKRGNPIRKAALVLACAHIFGQISYYNNLDKYFDCVYPIFEEDAIAYVRQEERERERNERLSSGSIVVDD